MVPNFLSAAWCGEAFHRLVVQDVESLVLVDALFPLDGGRRREGKLEKNIAMEEEGFPGARPTLQAVLWVTTIRCN
jgi:hypothetical protein